MPEKSIREMTKWERIHYSLAGKVFRITVLGAIILGLAAFLVGFGMYVYSLARQYIGISFETARSAAAVLEQAVDLESLADFVLTEYRSLPESERLDPESEEYLAHFQAIESEADYQTLKSTVNEVCGGLKAPKPSEGRKNPAFEQPDYSWAVTISKLYELYEKKPEKLREEVKEELGRALEAY